MALFDFITKKNKSAYGWNSRSGTKSGMMFTGEKFSGAMFYPSEYGKNYKVLRKRSRQAYFESTQARSMVSRLADNVIGTGLSLELAPVWDFIDKNMNDDQQREKTREIEKRFNLWADSKEPDAAACRDFYEIQLAEFTDRLKDGETFIIIRYSGESSRMSPINFQFISPDQVCQPGDREIKAAKTRGYRIIDGIEVDNAGKEIAIYTIEDGYKFTRIPFHGTSSSRRFVIHPKITDSISEVRGTPILAPMVHELQKITDGTVAELEAMVINALIAVWVKPSPDFPASRAFSGIRAKEQEYETRRDLDDTDVKVTSFDKPGLMVQSLKAGEEVQSFDTKRPNTNFSNFTRDITKYISGSIGIPIEVLEESFNANYSASRASLLLFWKTVEKWRQSEGSQFLDIVLEAWFSEEVKSGRIDAPGFMGNSPIIKRAWLNCLWNGDRLPSIDPQKEALADDLRINQGSTTRERVSLEFNGSDFQDNVIKLKKENQQLQDAQPDPFSDGGGF